MSHLSFSFSVFFFLGTVGERAEETSELELERTKQYAVQSRARRVSDKKTEHEQRETADPGLTGQ